MGGGRKWALGLAWLFGCAAPRVEPAAAPALPPPELLAEDAPPDGPRPEPRPAEKPSEPEPDFYGPKEILGLLEASPIRFEVVADARVDKIPLVDIVDGHLEPGRPLDPRLEVTRSAGGEISLELRDPPESIKEHFRRADARLGARDLEAAAAELTEAARLRPDYFKTFTHLGNVRLVLGDLEGAVRALETATRLNPIDFEAHLLLGEALAGLGQKDRARAALIEAYVLNPGDDDVVERLQSFLRSNHLRIRRDRLDPQARLLRVGEREVKLQIDSTYGMRWLGLLQCLACHRYEDKCRRRSEPGEGIPIRLRMYRECLINQAIVTALRLENQVPVPVDERRLYDAIQEGYLEAIVFWEIAAQKLPVVIALLPPESRAEIARYIERYVLEPAQSA